MKKLLIVDGSALLFQSFYGMPNKIKNQNGQYVEAVVCFLGILLKTIKMLKPSQLLIVFDGENTLVRQEIDLNYKANRQDFSLVEDADNPFTQLDIIKQVLTYLNFSWFETNNCEADDLIASICNDYSIDYEIIISSADKDFFQLVSDKISVFTYRGKISKLWTNEEIKNKYGFDAKYFSTFKSLVGDNSDNIKGIKGIGVVTATKLIQGYGRLENIFKNLNEIENKLSMKLSLGLEQCKRNYKIIELHSKSKLFSLGNCDFTIPDLSSTQILKDLKVL